MRTLQRMEPIPDDATLLAQTQRWLERAVIGLNLCPFAKAVVNRGQVRYVVTRATTAEALLEDLAEALRALAAADPDEVDTTLLIHPCVLQDFLDYNDFIELADAAVEMLGLEGVLQVAHFHPRFQFEGTRADDITNATNRAPWPTLHLLREASVDRAVDAFPEADVIWKRNMATLRRLGQAGWDALDPRREDPPAPEHH